MSYKSYVNRVLSYIDCNYQTRKRLKEDLLLSLDNRADGDTSLNPTELLGPPREAALEIIDDQDLRLSVGFEYISDTMIFGLPLVHITTKRNGFAKGILAIGMRSVGLISLGLLSFGLLSFGVVSVGILTSIGSLSVAGLFSMGAVAVSGGLSLGAVAVGNIALGALAYGDVAIGDVAYGNLAIYRSSGHGDQIVSIYESKEIIESLIREHVSSNSIADMIVNFIKSI